MDVNTVSASKQSSGTYPAQKPCSTGTKERGKGEGEMRRLQGERRAPTGEKE